MFGEVRWRSDQRRPPQSMTQKPPSTIFSQLGVLESRMRFSNMAMTAIGKGRASFLWVEASGFLRNDAVSEFPRASVNESHPDLDATKVKAEIIPEQEVIRWEFLRRPPLGNL